MINNDCEYQVLLELGVEDYMKQAITAFDFRCFDYNPFEEE